jgi:hypothetical protein
LYEPEAVLIAKDGRTVTGHTGIAAELERDLSLALPLQAKARHVFVAGDIAEIVLDWSIEAPLPVPWVDSRGSAAGMPYVTGDVVARGLAGLAVVLSAGWRAVCSGPSSGLALSAVPVRSQGPAAPGGVAFGQPGQRPFPAWSGGYRKQAGK